MTDLTGRIKLRLADLGDLTAIVGLFDDSVAWLVEQGIERQWGTTPFSAVPERVERFKNWISEGVCYVATVGDEIVGTMVLTDGVPEYAKKVAENLPVPALYVEAFTTKRSYTGAGVGTVMLNWADHHTRTQGIKYLRLDCWADSPKLPGYYAGHGFIPLADFYVGEWRGQLFEKPLST